MSVISVRKIFDASAGSKPSFFKIKGIEEPKRFPIKYFQKQKCLVQVSSCLIQKQSIK